MLPELIQTATENRKMFSDLGLGGKPGEKVRFAFTANNLRIIVSVPIQNYVVGGGQLLFHCSVCSHVARQQPRNE